MLAGVEKAVHAWKSFEVSGEKTAIETMLAGLIDYAGLYPPTSLDMRRAVDNYLAYRSGTHAYALGRFIVDVNRLDELRSAAANDFHNFRISLIVPADADGSQITTLLDDGARIESVEMKLPDPRRLEQIGKSLSANLVAHIEVPIEGVNEASLEAIAAVGMRLKLRMGGVVPEAFPSSRVVAHALTAVAGCHLPFKATAGLHHPVRSPHRLTYAASSGTGVMHGFVNLFCATALVHFGGSAAEAEQILEERDPGAWELTAGAICWRSRCWTIDRLSATRKRFMSFGSCSFEEPIRDLEAMGWL
jgi:hypothetical protein